MSAAAVEQRSNQINLVEALPERSQVRLPFEKSSIPYGLVDKGSNDNINGIPQQITWIQLIEICKLFKIISVLSW